MNSFLAILSQADTAIKSGLLNTARLAFERACREAREPLELAFTSYQFGAFFWGTIGDGTEARRYFEETVTHWKRAVDGSRGNPKPPLPLLANAAENLMLLSLSFEEFDRWADELRGEAPQEEILHQLVPVFSGAREAGEPWSSVMLQYALNYINPSAVAGAGQPASGACLFQLLIENRKKLRVPLQTWRAAVLGYVCATSSILGRADDLILKRTGRRQPDELMFATRKRTTFLDEYCAVNPTDQELVRLRAIEEDTLRKMKLQRTAPLVAPTATARRNSSSTPRNEAMHFIFVVLFIVVGIWPFLIEGGFGWKILGGVSLVFGVSGFLALLSTVVGRDMLRVHHGTTVNLRQIEDEYRKFSESCPRLSLRVVAVECDPFANATLLIRPATPPADPQGAMSFVKARLFTLIPAALDGLAHLRVEQHPTVCSISYHGRDFAEPSWYVSDGCVRVGPLGFRHGAWDGDQGVFRFTLMETSFTTSGMMSEMSSVGGSKASIINEVAAHFRDRLGDFTI